MAIDKSRLTIGMAIVMVAMTLLLLPFPVLAGMKPFFFYPVPRGTLCGVKKKKKFGKTHSDR